MHTIFIELLGLDEKAIELETHIRMISESRFETHRIYLKNPSDFALVNGTPFAYWVEENFIKKLRQFDNYDDEDSGRGTRCGLGTLNDFRFLRLRCEVDLITNKNLWKSYLHGGIYSPIYDEFPLVTNWGENGDEVKAFVEAKVGSASRKVQGEDKYFQRGFIFSRRTRAFSPKVMVDNSIFSTAGQAGFSPKEDLQWTIALMSSIIPGYIISLSQGAMAKGGGPSPQFEVGLIKRLPWPEPTDSQKKSLADTFFEIYTYKRDIASRIEPSNWFTFPPLYDPNNTLLGAFNSWIAKLNRIIENYKLARNDINEISCQLYGLASGKWQSLLQDLIGDFDNADASIVQDVVQADPFSDGLLDNPDLRSIDFQCNGLLSFLSGCVYGRWSIQHRKDSDALSEYDDPFEPFHICAPGMLQNKQGLPAKPNDVTSGYPLRVSWSGILPDDPGHSEDIVNRLRDALQVIWADHAEAIETEACEILGVGSLREYFQRTNLFFDDHLKRYSKSRRYAPIYWPLSTPSGSYTLWLYYHRINDQILFACVNDFIDPKLKQVGEDLVRLRGKSGRSSDEESELERLSDLERELKDFRAELLRVAAFWKPNLNDGVQITAAPLWRLFQHRNWQNRLKDTWEKLEAGEYDWAHMAYSIWPERVREKCKTDKSLAIAHDLEHLYVETPKKGKKSKRKKSGQANMDL